MPSLTRKYMPGKDTHFYFFFLNKRKFRNVLELEQGTHHQKEKKKKNDLEEVNIFICLLNPAPS